MTNVEVLSYEQYFGEMPISEEEKKRRIEFAKQMEELFIILFVLMRQAEEEQYIDPSSTEQRIRDVLEDNGVKISDAMEALVIERVSDIIAITQRHPDDAWYLSDRRAILLAEEETNTLLNRADFEDAKASGKTLKRWVTMQDDRVRPTHKFMNQETKPIDEDFMVGGYPMMFPRDTKGPPQEVAECRCFIVYFNEGEDPGYIYSWMRDSV